MKAKLVNEILESLSDENRWAEEEMRKHFYKSSDVPKPQTEPELEKNNIPMSIYQEIYMQMGKIVQNAIYKGVDIFDIQNLFNELMHDIESKFENEN